LSKEQAQAIIEHSTDQLKKHIELAERDLSAQKTRGETVTTEKKELLEARIRGLENFLAELHSKDELKDLRQAVRLDVSNAAQKALEARQGQGIRDTASEDSLRAIQSQQFDPVLRAKRMITAATELIAQLELRIKEAADAKKDIPGKITVLLRNASDHLAKAKAAFESGDFGETFGQANSSIQNSKAALSYFDALRRGSEGEETTERVCAAIPTPARNIKTQECTVFSTACFPDGWKLDHTCLVVGVPKSIQNILPQAVPAPAGVAPTIPQTWEVTLSRAWEVKITDEGFFPRELTIKEGDAVIWTSGGSRPHWPASAVHPTHTNYPERGGCIGSSFDACRGLETGEKFEFKFNQVGAWKYHDHLNSSLSGAIIVVGR